MTNQPENSLPFRIEEEKNIAFDTSQSVVNEFTDPMTKETWVRKEMRQDTFRERDPETVAKNKNTLLQVMKEYAGEYIPDTYYAVAKDEEGKPTVQIVQKKISGKTYREKENSKELKSAHKDARRDIMQRIVKMVLEDERVQENPELYRTMEAYSNPDNIMIDEDNKMWVVDW